MNRQERYREAYRRLRPGWRDSLDLYCEAVGHRLHRGARLLDLGCGHATLLERVVDEAVDTHGIDPDVAALGRNRTVRHRVAATAEALPYAAGSFDVVVSAWVLEHVDEPSLVFGEVHRVLRPGGVVVSLTPNALNYNAWVIRAIPNRLHGGLVRRIYGRERRDVFPVRYRVNSPRRMERVTGPLGFRRLELVLNGDPTYVSLGPVSFRVAVGLERLLDLPLLRRCRVHLITVHQRADRPGDAGPTTTPAPPGRDPGDAGPPTPPGRDPGVAGRRAPDPGLRC